MLSTLRRYQLRDYQHKWIDSIWKSWASGNRRVLAQLPTAAGKTVCFAHICHQFFQQEEQVLVVAHRIELIFQAAEKLEEIIGEQVGIIKAGIPGNPERRVQVASVQTLSRRKLLQLPLNVGLVIFDEAHHATALSYRRLIEHYKNAQILGVTATPQRVDGQGFLDLFDDLVVGVDSAKLILNGYLSKFRLFATEQTISTVGVSKTHGDFSANQLAVSVTSQIGAREIVANYLKYAQNLRTVVFACSVEHSRAIVQEFCRYGISAEHLDGKTDTEERVAILQRFKNGATQVITNYEILTEGYDCPTIECIYCVRPTESSTLWLQMVGRVLRTYPFKPTAVIIDVTENWKKHGLPDEQRQWSLAPKSVLECNAIRMIQCKHCTHAFRPLTKELEILHAEMGEDGLLIQHHQAKCPSCLTTIDFTTKENIASTPSFKKIRLKHSMKVEITEINLSVSPYQIELVYDFLKKQFLSNSPPSKIYGAIFVSFIETIAQFTLGDWRAIVKMVEPEILITQKAWQLYTEGLDRHKNRMQALSFIEQRKSLGQNNISSFDSTKGKPTAPVPAIKPKKTIAPLKASIDGIEPPISEESSKFKKNLGDPYFCQKYAAEWKNTLANCSMLTGDFLKINAGLFHVEIRPLSVNISIEVRQINEIKTRLNEILDQAELEKAFSETFGKQANVTLRV